MSAPAPWLRDSSRPWSLWDMFPKKIDGYVAGIMRVVEYLKDVEALRNSEEVIHLNDLPLIEPHHWLETDPEYRPGIESSIFAHIRRFAAETDMVRTQIEANTILFSLVIGIPLQKLIPALEQLKATIAFDSKQLRFLYLNDQNVGLWTKTAHKEFGQSVLDRFPQVQFELEEAMKCMAVGRSTACVFHLMRALEAPLVALWKGANCQGKRATNWKEFTDQIESAAKCITDTAEQDFFRGAVARLRDVKDRWRNPTMHEIALMYTDDEGKQIKQAITLLLGHLAEHLDEQGKYNP